MNKVKQLIGSTSVGNEYRIGVVEKCVFGSKQKDSKGFKEISKDLPFLYYLINLCVWRLDGSILRRKTVKMAQFCRFPSKILQ